MMRSDEPDRMLLQMASRPRRPMTRLIVEPSHNTIEYDKMTDKSKLGRSTF
jgi:hypothetical protein